MIIVFTGRTANANTLTKQNDGVSHAASSFASVNPIICSLCETLLWTGCRISEALALTTDNIFAAEGVVVIRTLKQGGRLRFWQIPVPPQLIELIDRIHDLDDPKPRKLWPWHRVTAYHHIKAVMKAAEISGLQASPKGLRHSFGVHCTMTGVAALSIQRWLGHTDPNSTMIYTHIVGAEERAIVRRCWENIEVAPDLEWDGTSG